MGQSAAQTVKEIEQTRERIESNLDQLEERMPAPARTAKRAAGVALGGGVGGTALLLVMKRVRTRRKAKAAETPVTAVVNVLPERWADLLDDEKVRTWGAGFFTAWLVMRSLELRQLRALRRAVIAR